MTEIGFIGLGHMGCALAQRLIDAKYSLIIYDIDCERVDRLISPRCKAADSVVSLADTVDTIFACLPSKEISISVASDVRKGKRVTTYVEMSTIGRDAISAILDVFKGTKVEVVDAPVSGGPHGAQANTLSVMIAAQPEARERVWPFFTAMANKLFIVGSTPGLAQVCKLVNNAISLSSLIVSCEAIVLGVSVGLNAVTLIDVINASTGRNSATLEKFPRSILPRTFDFGAPLEGAIKDLSLFLELAQSCGQHVECIAAIKTVWMQGRNQFGGSVDYTNIVKLFEQRAGTKIIDV